jgi:hypothetical protein
VRETRPQTRDEQGMAATATPPMHMHTQRTPLPSPPHTPRVLPWPLPSAPFSQLSQQGTGKRKGVGRIDGIEHCNVDPHSTPPNTSRPALPSRDVGRRPIRHVDEHPLHLLRHGHLAREARAAEGRGESGAGGGGVGESEACVMVSSSRPDMKADELMRLLIAPGPR